MTQNKRQITKTFIYAEDMKINLIPMKYFYI